MAVYRIKMIMEVECDTFVEPYQIENIVREHFRVNEEIEDVDDVLLKDYLVVNEVIIHETSIG